MSLPNLTGKVCLVTGASRGIGKGIALQLAKSGATVYITGRKLEDLKKCAEEMKQSGGQNVLPLQGKLSTYVLQDKYTITKYIATNI